MTKVNQYTKAEIEAARDESVAHWERIACDPYKEDAYRSKCALCSLFNTDEMKRDDKCIGCPVHAETGRTGCVLTPYHEYVEAFRDLNNGCKYTTLEDVKAIALKEVSFLKQLEIKEPKVKVPHLPELVMERRRGDYGQRQEWYSVRDVDTGLIILNIDANNGISPVGYVQGVKLPMKNNSVLVTLKR